MPTTATTTTTTRRSRRRRRRRTRRRRNPTKDPFIKEERKENLQLISAHERVFYGHISAQKKPDANGSYMSNCHTISVGLL